jgi:phosphatidylserine/phosphatidylglycerophosphate/cardiolipin synthase-like enzyme
MGSIVKKNGNFSVRAHVGDCKTLLAWNLPKAQAKNLAGFTIQYTFPGSPSYYIPNEWAFEHPEQHAQDAKFPATSSINSPLHKFRWLHIPGSLNQGANPFYGPYVYTVTPRYFDGSKRLQAIDLTLGASVQVNVGPFVTGEIELGFTRGFVQSQAFQLHFGDAAVLRPADAPLIFDTTKTAGTNHNGQRYTFADEFQWSGFTARQKIFAWLDAIIADKTLRLDMFAYDLSEPDVISRLLQLAGEGRVRLILDNASLHHQSTKKTTAKPVKGKNGKKPKGPPAEDQFEKLFLKAAKKGAAIQRGKFGRYAHDKVLVVAKKASDGSQSYVKVLTGSTNFSITGMYVNSNHVIIFNDAGLAATYGKVFEEAWSDEEALVAFRKSAEATQTFSFHSPNLPQTDITFSPHTQPDALKRLDEITDRMKLEARQAGGSVLFAVMGLTTATGPVLPALQVIHKNETIFSYGISDAPGGIYLYSPRKKTGVLVSGKPGSSMLPPPFNQVPQIGIGHQIHHKFIVCGFNGPNPVVYCGSSNLALGGETNNGDNLIAIHDGAVATAFAIEALSLVDHFDFLDRHASKVKTKASKVKPVASKQKQAALARWYESTDDKWAQPYFDSGDLRFTDRELFS